MSDPKTKPTSVPVAEFIATIADDRRRAEAEVLVALMAEVTGAPPVMWGPTMIGFGTMHYTSSAGRGGDWFKVGFSPRKAAISLYGLRDQFWVADALDTLGPHTAGVGCVYVKRLELIDLTVLRRLVAAAFARGDFVAPKRTPTPRKSSSKSARSPAPNS